MRIFLFLFDSELKSLLTAFTHTQNAPVKLRKISNEFYQGELTIIFFFADF